MARQPHVVQGTNVHGKSPLRPGAFGDKRKHDLIDTAAQTIAQLETALYDDIAKACPLELLFNDRLPD